MAIFNSYVLVYQRVLIVFGQKHQALPNSFTLAGQQCHQRRHENAPVEDNLNPWKQAKREVAGLTMFNQQTHGDFLIYIYMDT